MTQDDLVRAAGLFEGEGTVVLYSHPSRGRGQPVMAITMTDREPVEWWASVWGGQCKGPYQRKGKPNWASYWTWQTSRWSEVERIYLLMKPWLFSRRRRQFEEILKQFPPDLRGRPPRVNGLQCPTEVIPSKSGYMRHYIRGEKACAMCLKSYAMWNRVHRASRSGSETH